MIGWIIGAAMVLAGGWMHCQNTSSVLASPLAGFGGVILLIKWLVPGA
jgi:hypothetical protein